MPWATIRTTTAIEDLNVDVTAQLQGPICYSKKQSSAKLHSTSSLAFPCFVGGTHLAHNKVSGSPQ